MKHTIERTSNGLPPIHPGEYIREALEDLGLTQAVLTVAAKPGPRTVCVRVVDLFGFEAEVVAVVAAVAAV